MDKENIQRIDNRSGSIYSIIIFIFVFTFCYIFYPQISMLLPFFGDNQTISNSFEQVGFDTLSQKAEYIVIGMCTEKSKAEYTLTQSKTEPIIVYKNVLFNNEKIIKGSSKETFSVHEYGGSILLSNGSSRKKKYNVSYTDSASFKENKTYVLFLDENGEVLNGKYGIACKNSDGNFVDGMNKSYSVNDLIMLVTEAE